MQDATGAELWAAVDDVPYIAGDKKRPGVKRILETILRPQKPDITGTYDTNWPYNAIHVLQAPGHTPGHTIFEFQNVMFTGDLFKFISGRYRLFPEYMNWNQVEAENSLSLLKTLTFDFLCPSHVTLCATDQSCKLSSTGLTPIAITTEQMTGKSRPTGEEQQI